MTDHELVTAIVWQLDGTDWSPDTLEEIAALLRRAGYIINDPVADAETDNSKENSGQ